MLCLHKLKTRDRLKKMGICQGDDCGVCGMGTETCFHLFLDCSYSSRVLQLMRDTGLWSCNHKSAGKIAQWIKRRFEGSRFQKKVSLAFLSAVVYRVWTNRNKVLWDNKFDHPKTSSKLLIEEVKSRIRCGNAKGVKGRSELVIKH